MKRKLVRNTNISQKRFIELARMDQAIFHINDLAKIWGLKNRSNLRVTMKRYVDAGLVYRLYRGLYAFKKPVDLDPVLLGTKAINSPCYFSTESVLASAGAIFQGVSYYTFVGRRPRRFAIGPYRYYCRQLKDSVLFNDLGVEKAGQVSIASPERAAADMLYFNPKYHFDNTRAFDAPRLAVIAKAVYGKKYDQHQS